MKKLYLLRHAEAEKKAGQTDFERALTPHGASQAELLGNYMKERNIIPELIFCSDSVRAKQTLGAIDKVLSLAPKTLVYEHKLYNSSVEELENQVLSVGDSLNSLMLIAHNPAITSFPLRLQLIGEITGLDDYDSTCKFVALRLELTSWSELLTANGSVESIMCP